MGIAKEVGAHNLATAMKKERNLETVPSMMNNVEQCVPAKILGLSRWDRRCQALFHCDLPFCDQSLTNKSQQGF